MRIKASIKTVSLSAATVAVAICAQAHAQDAGSASSSRVLTDDDIIVTARKLTETVTDVPATINVVTAEDLASRRLGRSEEHTSELQSLMRISYAVFCLKKKNKIPVPKQKTKYTNHAIHTHKNRS